MNKFEQLKQEFLALFARNDTEQIMESALSTLLTTYDESKWKPYPENKPKSSALFYLVQCETGYMDTLTRADFRRYDVIAFRELPKPYGKEEQT